MLDLRTIPDVELLKVGTWDTSTVAAWVVSPEMLTSTHDFFHSGRERKPALKFGHTGEFGVGDPALGYVDNMRLTDGGGTLIGDYVGVPAALAELLAAAYPDRSGEFKMDHTDHTGQTWPLVMLACSLLGGRGPGVRSLKSLQDVASLYGVAATSRHYVIGAEGRVSNATPHGLAVAVAAARRRRASRINQPKG